MSFKKEDFNNLVKTLCQKHVDIKHDDDAKVRFFPNPDFEPKNMENEFYVFSLPPRKRFKGENDSLIEVFCGELLIIKPVPGKDNYSGQEQAVKEAEVIVEDFMTRIKQEKRKNRIADFNGVDIKTEETGPLLQSCFGLRVQFFIGFPNNLKFERSKWTDGDSVDYQGI